MCTKQARSPDRHEVRTGTKSCGSTEIAHIADRNEARLRYGAATEPRDHTSMISSGGSGRLVRATALRTMPVALRTPVVRALLANTACRLESAAVSNYAGQMTAS